MRYRALAAILLALLPARLVAATWYVDNQASGLNNGTSLVNAWQSVAAISWASLYPGDVIYWHEGSGASYGSVTVTRSGSNNTVAGLIKFIGVGATHTTKPKLTSLSANGPDFVAFVNFEINGTGTAVSLSGATGWLLMDLYIHGGRNAFILDRDAFNSYNVMRGCVIEDMLALNGLGNIAEQQNWIGGDRNVLEYTSIGKGGDRLNIWGALNVFRNCYLGPMTPADLLGGADPHIDDYQVYYRSTPPGARQWDDKQLVEALFTHGNQTGDSHFNQLRDQDNASGTVMRGIICRFNVVTDIRRFGEIDYMEDLWYYNNTFVDLNLGDGWTVGQEGGVSNWINNSFTRTNDNLGSRNILLAMDGATMTSSNNHEYLSGELPGTQLENTAPQFTNEAVLNFMPTSGSPLRGAQAPITLANGSGSSSTSLVVDESNRFSDGWGIVEGDLIRIGGGAWVRIADVDYATHTITLAEARTWSDNAAVELFGTEDAIGALAYRAGGYTLSGTISNVSTTYTVAANDAALCRMVVFYEDGVPQAPDYDAPFAYTSAGGAVTARLYPRFASQTLSVLATESGEGDTTDPVVTITSPTSSATLDTSTSPLTIGGTASDAVGVTSVTWTNSAGGSGTASGTTSWSFSAALTAGTNLITVTAHDAAGNTGTDQVTITYTPPTPPSAGSASVTTLNVGSLTTAP